MLRWPAFKTPSLIPDKKSTHVDIVQKLTTLRVSGYSASIMAQITDDKLTQIKELVIDLGNRLLKVNIAESVKLEEAKLQFKARINTLFESKQKFSTLSFACQLMQYFTITSNKDFDPTFDFQNFIQFLENRQACRHFLRNLPGRPSPRKGQKKATSMPPAALAVLVPLDFQPPTGLKICAPQ